MSDVLIYDIETKTFGKPDSMKDRLRIFGCYSYKTGKCYMLTNKTDIQSIIDKHKFIVGFNNKDYDNPILIREGIRLKYKIIIDLKQLISKRAGSIKIEKGLLENIMMKESLDYITKMLGLVTDEGGKKEIDYGLFQKDIWTPEEKKIIYEYTKRDIIITKKLYEWAENYFDSFKPFITKEDVRKKVYLTASIAKFSYKAICKAMDWEELYGDMAGSGDRIKGGYVAYPAGEKFEGDIYCLDFASLYPHIMIQCNLYGRKKEGILDDRPTWYGGNKWKVNGTYYSDEISDVGKLLKRWYGDRVKYKDSDDKREYTIKIILNTIYGILNTPYYSRVYDLEAGGDCTRIARQWTKYARKVFRDNGYKVLYTDTDSVFIHDIFNDKEKMLKVKDKIIKDIKDSVPFPQDTFDMDIDDEIKYIFFFKGGKNIKHDEDEMDEDDIINKPKNLMKKNYIYVTKEGKVHIKNLGIRKKSISPLSKKIFWDYFVPQIIEKGQIKFSRVYIKSLIDDLLSKDVNLVALRKSIGNYQQYAKTSPNSIQAQIAQRYGSGIHFLVPNNRGIGVGKGKGKKLCTLEEFKQNKLRVEDIELTNVWSELDYFIKPVVIKNIFDFGGK